MKVYSDSCRAFSASMTCFAHSTAQYGGGHRHNKDVSTIQSEHCSTHRAPLLDRPGLSPSEGRMKCCCLLEGSECRDNSGKSTHSRAAQPAAVHPWASCAACQQTHRAAWLKWCFRQLSLDLQGARVGLVHDAAVLVHTSLVVTGVCDSHGSELASAPVAAEKFRPGHVQATAQAGDAAAARSAAAMQGVQET
eukprot:9138-Heterococcus_DN1.PRE.2